MTNHNKLLLMQKQSSASRLSYNVC